ncbi:cytochrome c peroxidase [Haliangium sp.]|uniref:YncE family protein n=1 Tax=Haliangium sp. TaxID=2663208 RepID=UPI003D09C134
MRTSLVPSTQLTPTAEFTRFRIFGQQMTAADFQANTTLISVEQRMNAIGVQLGAERGVPAIDVFIDSENRTRAATMPFRGKPSDVDFIEFNGIPKAYIPLGGEISLPDNEVAVVDLDNGSVERINVGLRPQRLVVDQNTGLVFVCNEYSNYISILDTRTDELLEVEGVPVEIQTDFFCRDLLVVERNPGLGEFDELFLFVANELRASVMKYSIDVLRDINTSDIVGIQVNPAPDQPPNVPFVEIIGVGRNPYRLHLDESQSRVYVAGGRGGELALIDIATDQVVQLTRLGGPAMDLVQIDSEAFVATTTLHRGFPNRDAAALNDELDFAPIHVFGVNGLSEQAHSGSTYDGTNSYGVEDVRNTIAAVGANLDQPVPTEFVDNVEVDSLYDNAQKQLTGALPWDLERNAAGNQMFVAHLGSDSVQVLDVQDGQLIDTGVSFQTSELPAAVALDEDNGKLLVVTMGANFLEVFDLNTQVREQEIDLGYGTPRYPATTVEAGEYFFATARWSGNGRKACASCHTDRLLADGLPFAGDTTAPTMPHQIKPLWNLMETEGYFWNGSFTNNSSASLAFAAQTRTNCEIVMHALVEGVDSDPATRVGDAFNYTSDAVVGRNGADADSDVNCRPTFLRDNLPGDGAIGQVTDDLLAGLPGPLTGVDLNNDGRSNFLDILAVITAQKQVVFQNAPAAVADQLARAGLTQSRDELSRAIDFYTVATLRLPPNPIAQMAALELLDEDAVDKLVEGERIFNDVAQCNGCHQPDNLEMPFSDGRDHGAGGGWMIDFVNEYDQDPRLTQDPILLAVSGNALANGVPEQMRTAAGTDFTTQEVNFHLNPIDFFVPFCFTDQFCLRFDNPLRQNGASEDERLFRMALLNLADLDRGFVPAQPPGQPRVNTPSLRGVWQQHNYLRHGQAFSLRAAVLPPGHAALGSGENGFAVDRRDNFDVHGLTRDLSEAEVEALEFYLQSIE